jgi:serine/threonine protein kinase
VRADLDGNRYRVGPYRIERRLSAGGMGVVYLGHDEATGTVAAVKVIKPEFAADRRFRARLRREVAAARRVPRFCTAPVVGADLDAEPPYIATEYINGPTLDVAVLERGPMRGPELAGLATGIAVALRAIHDQGVIHRDLKPSNILLSGVGPRVIDFGIARLEDAETQLTQVGGLVGTLAYMAPEQLNGGPVTTAIDLFAWAGVVTYAATGRPPFGTGSEVRERVLAQEPDLGGLDEPLRRLVVAAFAKDHTRRPSAAELVEGLARIGPAMTTQILEMATTPPAPAPALRVPAALPLNAPPPGRSARTAGAGPGRRNIAIGAVAGAAALVLGGAGLLYALNGGGDGGDRNARHSSPPSTPASSGGREAAAVPPGGCTYSPDGRQGTKDVGTPPVTPRYNATSATTVHTNLGAIAIELNGKKAPCTVNSFAYLAGKNFYDNTRRHRLVTQGIKVLQCGDPTGTGTGGPGYEYADENLPTPRSGAQTVTYAKGTLAMANAGPGTNGSQFFIVYGDSELPPNYTIFGKVTGGTKRNLSFHSELMLSGYREM